jgi:hypothetical protein
MPTGPKGEKRPRDTVSAAVMVAKIATKQIKDEAAKRPTKRPKKTAKKAAKASWK